MTVWDPPLKCHTSVGSRSFWSSLVGSMIEASLYTKLCKLSSVNYWLNDGPDITRHHGRAVSSSRCGRNSVSMPKANLRDDHNTIKARPHWVGKPCPLLNTCRTPAHYEERTCGSAVLVNHKLPQTGFWHHDAFMEVTLNRQFHNWMHSSPWIYSRGLAIL